MSCKGLPFIGGNRRFRSFQGDSPKWQQGNAAMPLRLFEDEAYFAERPGFFGINV